MSVAIETIVVCDSCGHQCSGDDRRLSAKEIREVRKISGWRRVGSEDFCGECVKKGEAKEARRVLMERNKQRKNFRI